MVPLPLALCVFDSTRGHFGRHDIYKRTITDLTSKIPLECFKVKVVHVKISPGEESIFEEQRQFYTQHGFEVLRTEGSWKHFDEGGQNSHQRGYSKDLITVYGHPSVLSCDYILHLESDWTWSLNGGEQLIDLVSLGLAYLASTPTLIGVRFPRFTNEVARLNNLEKKHGLHVWTQQETRNPFSSFTLHNDRISLNPILGRSRDWYMATRLMKRDFERLGNHVEHQYGEILRMLADGALPWAIYDPTRVSILHGGTKEGEEDATPPYERIES